MASAPQSVTRRALLAVGLMVGFYALALGIAGLLLYLPFAEWRYLERVDLRLVVSSLVGEFGILTGVAPRIDRLPDPEPKPAAADQPGRLRQVWDRASQSQGATNVAVE